jgi:hypothetical protein
MKSSSRFGNITVLAAVFLAGQTIACRADVDDGKTGSGSDTASVVTGNTAPEVSSVTLTPSALYTNDTVTAVATTTDADGDELTLSYAFSVDGSVVQDSLDNSLDGTVYFDKGQAVTVTVTADDGTDSGSDDSESITVLNTAPTAPEVSIAVGCEDGWTEMPDGIRCAQAFNTSTDWRGSQDNCESLGGNLVRIGDAEDNAFVIDLYSATGAGSVWFHAGLTDEAEEGSWTWLDGVESTYRNWDSGQPDNESEDCLEVVASGWGNTTCDDTSYTGHVCQIENDTGLTCIIDEDSTDDDGDTVTYDFSWDVDGMPFDGDTVSGLDLGYDETWTCEVTPNDGEADGSSASASYVTDSGVKTSCYQWLEAGFSDSGLYLIETDDLGTVEVYCDMETDGGGWTRIFLASGTNLSDTAGADYTVGAFALRRNAAEAMTAFVDTSNNIVDSYATFAMPNRWVSQSPLMYGQKIDAVDVQIDGSSVGTKDLIYGKNNPSSYTCDGWVNDSPSGQLCIDDTTAPHYTRFAWTHVDRCNASDEDERTFDCTDDTKFSILVREDPDSTWTPGVCGSDDELVDGEVCLSTLQYAGPPWQSRYLSQGSDITGGPGWTDSSLNEATTFCAESGYENARVVWPAGDTTYGYTFYSAEAPTKPDGIWAGHIEPNINVQREVVCW